MIDRAQKGNLFHPLKNTPLFCKLLNSEKWNFKGQVLRFTFDYFLRQDKLGFLIFASSQN